MSKTIINNEVETHMDRVSRDSAGAKVASEISRTKTTEPKPTIHKVGVTTRTIPAKFLESCEKYPDKPALLYKKGHVFEHIQYKRLKNLVENFTLSLEQLGVEKNDRVVLVSENRPEWAVADLSVKSLGAILVPIHKVSSAEQIRSIVHEVEPSLIVVSDGVTLFKVQQATNKIKQSAPIVFLEVDKDRDKILTSDGCDFISALKLVPHENYSLLYRDKAANVEASEVASIIYTPDAKGGQKGVQLTHDNFISNVDNCKEAITFREDDRFLSVLPLSHAFEKTAGYYIPLFTGSTIHYISDIARFSKDVEEYKPTVIIGVPRIFEKTFQRSKAQANKSKLGKYIFKKAYQDGKEKTSVINPMKFAYEKLIYSKVRRSLGGQIRFVISGGAALNPEVSKFFQISGIPILDGYGLTETAPVVSVNRLENTKLGTVGQPLPNVDIKIAEDSEILIKGPCVMRGYFKNEAENKRIFDDGWLKTGDYGQLDKEGFLKITGRKKELIILSTGKNVSPAGIEAQIKKSKLIKQAIVVGDGKKSIAALIVPDDKELSKRLSKIVKKELLQSKDARGLIQKEIDTQLLDFAHYEQVRRFRLLDKLFTKEDGTLDYEGRLARNIISKKYQKQINYLYKETNNPVN